MPFLVIALTSLRNAGWIDHSAFLAEGSRRARGARQWSGGYDQGAVFFEQLGVKLSACAKLRFFAIIGIAGGGPRACS